MFICVIYYYYYFVIMTNTLTNNSKYKIFIKKIVFIYFTSKYFFNPFGKCGAL